LVSRLCFGDSTVDPRYVVHVEEEETVSVVAAVMQADAGEEEVKIRGGRRRRVPVKWGLSQFQRRSSCPMGLMAGRGLPEMTTARKIQSSLL
jgi:hypothetical protein